MISQQHPYINKTILTLLLILVVSEILISCTDFVSVPSPETSLTYRSVFKSDATANATINGIYERMVQGDGGFTSGRNSITTLTGLTSDEFQNRTGNPEYSEFYTNSISPNNSIIQAVWIDIYSHIYQANSIIEGISDAPLLTDTVKSQVAGEAKFVRALCYFYLTNLFGDIPLVTSTDYRINQGLTRSPNTEVYKQIVTDLLDAEKQISEQYIYPERIRPNSYAASALLARVYLYMQKWPEAEQEANKVINSGVYTIEPSLENVFKNSSNETIWQLKPVVPQSATFDGLVYLFSLVPDYVTLTSTLEQAFTANDERNTNWIGRQQGDVETYVFPWKYKIELTESVEKPSTEYLVTLRLAEQYLIRAEARAHQGNVTGANEDTNVIRERASLNPVNETDQSGILAFLIQENQREYFAEWGHRWLDLKRTKTADAVLSGLPGKKWDATDETFPIPQSEILRNPNLAK